MNATLLAALNDAERLLVAETEPAALDPLDEDAVIELHDRIRRARNKYVGQYRRGAASKVSATGGRGKASSTNRTAALKAEAFEEALSRVSRRLTKLANQSAAELRAERLAAARAAKGSAPAASGAGPTTTNRAARRRSQTAAPVGDRSARRPAAEKRRSTTQAATARRQARKDAR
jgi:hypothetical protein